jgi:hypothetical protein
LMQSSRLGQPPLLVPSTHSASSLEPQPSNQHLEVSLSSSSSNSSSSSTSSRSGTAGPVQGVEGSGHSQVKGDGGEEGHAAAPQQQQPQLQTGTEEETDPLEALQVPITHDAALLTGLGDYYVGRGKREAAAVCYARATQLSGPTTEGGLRKQALQNLKQGLQQEQQQQETK